MPSLFRLFAALPLWLLHGLGAAMGWVTWALSPTYRRRFAANAAQAGYAFAQVRAAVGHAGRMVFEMPRIWLDMGEKDPYRDSYEQFVAMLNKNQVRFCENTTSGGHNAAYWTAHLAEYLRWYAGDE